MDTPKTLDTEVSSTFRKGLLLLMAFDGTDHQMTLSELSRKTGMNRAVTRRLARTLLQMGLLTEVGQRFEMTVSVMRLTRGFIDGKRIAQVIQPNLRKAAAQIGESLSFALRDGSEATYVAHAYIEGKFTMNNVAIGTHVPLLGTGVGHAILANMTEDSARAATEGGADQVRAALELTRRRGFAFNEGGYTDGVDSLAVPVFGPDRGIKGAVSMIFPSRRYDPDSLPDGLVDVMRQCATDIGATL